MAAQPVKAISVQEIQFCETANGTLVDIDAGSVRCTEYIAIKNKDGTTRYIPLYAEPE